jgi:hypothetical protein
VLLNDDWAVNQWSKPGIGKSIPLEAIEIQRNWRDLQDDGKLLKNMIVRLMIVELCAMQPD